MIIGGLQKFSLLDYPEHMSAIIFTQGCNYRCQYCYNPMLVWPTGNGKLKDISSPVLDGDQQKGHSQIIPESDLFAFLKSRVGKLDAIVITGGEPTIHNDLAEFIARIRKLGYKIKLDTNGTNPDMIKKLVKENLVDYMAMDIKAPMEKYDSVVGVQADLKKLRKSIKIIRKSGLPYEFRTTAVPKLIELDDIKIIGKFIKGADKWYLQQFKTETDLVNKSFEGLKPYSVKELEKMCQEGRRYVQECRVR